MRERRARSSTFVVCVALNSMVCLSLGIMRTMVRISSSNPMSSMRSASSMQNTFRLLNVNPLVFCMWSSSLPGVATNKLTPLTSFSASARLLAPPMMSPCVCECFFMSCCATL